MNAEQLLIESGTPMEGPLIFSPKVFSDERGFFFESWNSSKWNQTLKEFGQKVPTFVQDNHSSSIYGVLRGLHFQLPPHSQGKLVRCIVGEIYDVAVDLRQESNTYLQSVGVLLSAKKFHQLWIPEGFAHGFLTLSDKAEVLYKTTDFWNRGCERSIRWDDSSLQIQWPSLSIVPVLSDKDNGAPFLNDLSKDDLFE